MRGHRLYDEALATLSRLHILPTATGKLALNSTFKSGFRQAITGGGSSGSFGVPAVDHEKKDDGRIPPDREDKRGPPSIAALDAYALERWETILHYMVSSGSGQRPTEPSPGVRFLLKTSGLMNEIHDALHISSAGFQFLLHSPHEQLWHLLLQYLQLAEQRRMDLVDVLSFFFMLSTMELGREYSVQNLTKTQSAMLEDLRDYGLIWQRKQTSKRFSPTRLSTTLTSSSPPLPSTSGASSGPQEGFIILETNYRIYAYTDNPLQTAVLSLFASLKYRFPNLVVGSITRESVKKALLNGISADQIISYLITHAHPNMRKNNPLLPVTVQDQIRLWELEKNRLKSREGFLYTAFASQADYELVLQYAKELDVVLWENASKRCFFGSLEGHANIKGFIERRTMGER
ncbi:transcription factor TFIIH complex subunit Tfb2 [Coprinopsis cinerea okayama7|uniref:RNA polymerase II transcription factor B subunit 2 n=1 Tax=Coprinopsis cinerea (strain Okayama-7 / 130 / ATCC MYA-4618 / FGSC 9003) TaxID=240176 RepID=A8NUW8_COPC7|nr:transcription factor TFIIH complex subunit Tfb2 [Coprinopsis cinerea okayama7\|eukprot:XP_001836551.2 transcription factor TFIIH complex subunit Tfb2 [Coprinopsis cinerea okayama7\